MDVRDLTTFEDGSFDVAIDKGKGAFGWAWAVVTGLGLMICAERYDGRDDDCQGRRVGELPLPCAYHRKILARQRPHSPTAPQDPPQQVVDDCTKEVDEVLRYGITVSPLSFHLRRPKCVPAVGGGRFLYLTFGQPHFRRRYLTRPDTTLEIQQIGDALHYYLYILRS